MAFKSITIAISPHTLLMQEQVKFLKINIIEITGDFICDKTRGSMRLTES